MHFPLMVDLTDRLTVVVGGGAVALRKCRQLLEFGARVRVVAPEFRDELLELAGAELCRRIYGPDCLEGAFLAVAATGDAAVNRAVYQDCTLARIPVNVCDQPELCTFFFPAVVHRGELVVSVSTGGESPALAARLRARLEEDLPPEEGERVRLLGLLRRRCAHLEPQRRRALAVQAASADLDKLEKVWHQVEEGVPPEQAIEIWCSP